MLQLSTVINDLPIEIRNDYTTNDRPSIVLLQDENGLGNWMKEHGFVVTHRDSMLRVSIHFHNTAEEIDALVEYLRAKSE